MGEKGEGSGVVGGGKWGRRGREVGGKGEGTGNGVPPCPPPLYWKDRCMLKYMCRTFVCELVLSLLEPTSTDRQIDTQNRAIIVWHLIYAA